MTPREQAAFKAGIEVVCQMALTAAVTIEVRDDAGRVQNQAAVAALQALADGTKVLMLGTRADLAPGHASSVVRWYLSTKIDP